MQVGMVQIVAWRWQIWLVGREYIGRGKIELNDSRNTSQVAAVVTKRSGHSVAETVSRFRALLETRGIKLFAVIDQRAEAQAAGLSLRETVLVIFGNPAAGTPVMEAAPLAALDLPLKVLVWADGGETRVSYTAPGALAARHGLDDVLAANLAGIDVLTDALVGP